MAVSATGILTIGRVKDYLEINEHSVILEKIVDGVSAQIEKYLNRKIRSQNFSEVYDAPRSVNYIELRQPDVTAVSLIFDQTQAAFNAKYTGSDSVSSIEVTDAAVLFKSIAGATVTTATVDFATYPTVPQIVTAAPASWTAAEEAWSIAASIDVPSSHLVRVGAQNSKNKTVYLEAWQMYDGEYHTDYPAGIIEFCEMPLGPRLRIDYTAGHVTIPADVELFALEMMQEAWLHHGTDSAVQSESEGDYSVTYRVPDISVQIKDRLSGHRRWTL